MRSFYQFFIRSGEILQPILLLAMRLICGYLFYRAGMGKLENIERTAHFFATLHIPLPLMSAYLVGAIEMGGGLLLMAGLATRLAAFLLSVTMVVALLTASGDAVAALFSDPSRIAATAPLPFLVTVLVLWAFGPGLLSIDALLKRFVFKGSGK